MHISHGTTVHYAITDPFSKETRNWIKYFSILIRGYLIKEYKFIKIQNNICFHI